MAIWIPAVLVLEFGKMGINELDYGDWKYAIEFQQRASEQDPEIMVLGDSRAKAAIVAKMLGNEARSFALGGSTPIENYYYLSHYLERHAPPKKIILSISPVHLVHSECFWGRSVSWGLLTKKEVLEVLAQARNLACDPFEDDFCRPARPWTWYTRLASYWLRLPFLVRGAHLSGFLDRSENNWARYWMNFESAGFGGYGYQEWYRYWRLGWEAHQQDFAANPLLDGYLEKLLTLANRHRIAVTYIVTPLNASSDQRLSEKFRSNFLQFLASLEKRHPEIAVDRQLPVYDDEDFNDSSHLNLRGAEKFTLRLKQTHFAKSDARTKVP